MLVQLCLSLLTASILQDDFALATITTPSGQDLTVPRNTLQNRVEEEGLAVSQGEVALIPAATSTKACTCIVSVTVTGISEASDSASESTDDAGSTDY
ncbi:hypothetical protein TcWFU_005158 [Taenia crassiceps]|uniref:Uncharacterized protein n=1 Tax=Taenia crassiceps TaxID=6207 RepID=A0ABR4Q226_9CEST